MKIIAMLTLTLPLLAAATENMAGQVVWVHDGDSFRLYDGANTVEIRLWGIDAPEAAQPGGKAAAKYLIKLIKNKSVRVECQDQDRYGRIVGKAYLGDRYLNLEMLKRGHAWWYRQHAPQETQFRDAEADARKNQLGLWRAPAPINPREWRQQHKHRRQ